MFEEGRFLPSVKAPDASGSGGVPADVFQLASGALSTLEGKSYQELHTWIEYAAKKGSAWLCEYLPPTTILKFLDLLGELWGFDRLLAYEDCDFEDPSDMPHYESYLDKFYRSNNGPSYQSNAVEIILKCLAREKYLCSEWDAKQIDSVPFDPILCPDIQDFMSDLLRDTGKISRHPFATYAAACITKEAELMLEWLRKGYSPEIDDSNLCHEVRDKALDFAMFEGDWSVQPAAVLLGLANEAGFFLKSAKRRCFASTETSRFIQMYALEFLGCKLGEFELGDNLTPQPWVEMTSTDENVSCAESGMKEQHTSPEKDAITSSMWKVCFDA